ncbi:TIGR02444 family protein [Sneathiella sp. P13V-1]|uniref:TIGR02444 family protein n=1 Tax=Sneathiella sp. P13V-1 TaxID=2697366 RepID=UPI00187B5804|nr:TIGR02444 family protein [Sneathiella sp. P13V-1]MBE7638282.1 TIGR02444 family protein [Sneathiella sp. P13V-1]
MFGFANILSGSTFMSERQSFWDFACEVYDNPSVQKVCLELQNEESLDVNCLLFCLWIAASGRGICEDRFWADLVSKCDLWQKEILAPLRAVRDSLRSKSFLTQDFSSSELRTGILEKELVAEKHQILWMESQHSAEIEKHEAFTAEECLQAYLDALPFRITAAGRKKVLSLSTIGF